MKTYKIKWSDGNGAASRGTDCDHVVRTTVQAENDAEALKIVYICRVCKYLKDVNGLNDEDFVQAVKDYCDDIEEDTDYLLDINPAESEENLDEINLDDIDGGDPWVISITDEGGKELYDGGYEVPDEQDMLANLPTTLTIPKDSWKEIKGTEEDDYSDLDILEGINDFVEDSDLDTHIRDGYDWVGTCNVSKYSVTSEDDANVTLTVEWEADID